MTPTTVIAFALGMLFGSMITVIIITIRKKVKKNDKRRSNQKYCCIFLF